MSGACVAGETTGAFPIAHEGQIHRGSAFGLSFFDTLVLGGLHSHFVIASPQIGLPKGLDESQGENKITPPARIIGR